MPDRGGDQLLLGDEHLEVALGVGLGELVGEGRVADLAVHGHHVGADAQRGQRVAVGLAGGHLLAPLVAGQLDLGAVGGGPGWAACGRARPTDQQVPFAAEFDHGPFRHRFWQGLAVPAFAVLHLRKTPALAGAGHDDGRLVAAQVARLGQGLVDGGDVVAVDDEHPGAERGRAGGVGVHVPAQSVGPRWPSRLTSTIAIRLASL